MWKLDGEEGCWERKSIHLEYSAGGEFHGDLAQQKDEQWALGKIKPETLLEAKMTQLKLSHFRQVIRRQDSLDKTAVLGKVKSSIKKRKTKYEMDGLYGTGHCGPSLIPRVTGVGADSIAHNNTYYIWCVCVCVCVCVYIYRERERRRGREGDGGRERQEDHSKV